MGHLLGCLARAAPCSVVSHENTLVATLLVYSRTRTGTASPALSDLARALSFSLGGYSLRC
jgi:hypothetical protein